NNINFNYLTEESIQLIQEQEVLQVACKQQDNEECEYKNEEFEYDKRNNYIIQQLNTGYQKNDGIVINKLVETYNHTLASYRKEFAPSLRSLSQEVLDNIKFFTQKYSFGANA
ncbi:23216_t:CDS:2, partial [Racocetra persica]